LSTEKFRAALIVLLARGSCALSHLSSRLALAGGISALLGRFASLVGVFAIHELVWHGYIHQNFRG
jgi:hypothetical protein